MFEADRTAGLVDSQGYLVEKKDIKPAEEKAPGKSGPVSGEHPGHEDPSAQPSRSEKAESEVTQKEKPASARSSSRHRRRRRSRSRRREKKKARGSPSPVEVAEKEELIATEPEAEEELEALEEEEEDPAKYELRQIAKPSSSKPLPRRPRTPSVSPPGYHSRDPAPIKRWKGWQHVYRGQERQARGKGKGGKGRPSKGKQWHRK